MTALCLVYEDSNECVLNSTGSSGNLLERDSVLTRQTKRYLIFCEIMETEQNYVEVLRSILVVIKVYDSFVCWFQNYKTEFIKSDTETWISDHEIHLLFSRIEHILEIHEKILEVLRREDRDWTGKNLVGHCFAHENERMMKYYVPYINSYDGILEVLNRIQHDSIGERIIKVIL